MSVLNAEAILAAKDRTTEKVPVPEWDGEVLIGTMGAIDAVRINDWVESLNQPDAPEPGDEGDDAIEVVTTDSPGGKAEQLTDPDEPPEQDRADEPDAPERPARRLTQTEHTELMLRYLAASILDPVSELPAFDTRQVEALGAKNPKVLGRLYRKVLDLHTAEQVELERFEKNSGGTPAEDSGGA